MWTVVIGSILVEVTEEGPVITMIDEEMPLTVIEGRPSDRRGTEENYYWPCNW